MCECNDGGEDGDEDSDNNNSEYNDMNIYPENLLDEEWNVEKKTSMLTKRKFL